MCVVVSASKLEVEQQLQRAQEEHREMILKLEADSGARSRLEGEVLRLTADLQV